MSEWKLKRFWSAAAVVPDGAAFRVELDGRPVKTPAKQTLAVPGRALAEALAAEWEAQEDVVQPLSMPLTRLSNSALDTVSTQKQAIVDMVAAYGASDLVCYRAERPRDLVLRQAAAWDPLLDFARETLGVEMVLQAGLMPVDQPAETRQRIAERTDALDAFKLTALHELVALSGSWLIGYAALTDHAPAETLWRASIVDDLYQAEQWGDDAEALDVRARREADFLRAKTFADLSG